MRELPAGCSLSTCHMRGARGPGEGGSPRGHRKAWGLVDSRELQTVLEQWRVMEPRSKGPCLSSYSSNKQ